MIILVKRQDKYNQNFGLIYLTLAYGIRMCEHGGAVRHIKIAKLRRETTVEQFKKFEIL